LNCYKVLSAFLHNGVELQIGTHVALSEKDGYELQNWGLVEKLKCHTQPSPT
jgi:hypothetical protein